ncbi:MAG TPA: site-specific integrase [Actinophytocola sp.]|uniref:tyrosine-type recombinase/integrase n=1 Tax=Actinophytocola sp. TaxID=1872138 RepID=UPI002E06E083|nr:site-specific integrase [Actinophytocola sp.]
MWLPSHVVEANTRQSYTHIVERYLLAEFGSMRMNEILPAHVRDFFRRLQQRGSSAFTVQRCRTVLGAIFTTALNDRVIFLHPCTGVRTPTVPVAPLRILTPDELEAIISALPDKRWRLLVEVAIGSGLRWGELVELRVDALDATTGMLTVARTVVELRPRFHPDGGRFQVKDYPKNQHYRRLLLDAALVELIQQHIVDNGLQHGELLFAAPQSKTAHPIAPPVGGATAPNQAGRCYRHGTMSGYSAGGCRCEHCRAAYAYYRALRRAAGKDRPPAGRHLPRDFFRQQVWKPALAAAGITRRIRFHDLRHAHASWLVAGGADLQTVRERLGHASLRATEKYLHSLPGTDYGAIEALARIRHRTTTATPAVDHARPQLIRSMRARPAAIGRGQRARRRIAGGRANVQAALRGKQDRGRSPANGTSRAHADHVIERVLYQLLSATREIPRR